ncbi:tRNA (guanosine(37)-N1)-methyltransferase TrmD [Candidatus Microgenomates bacterium]|nr:MAG: tRNA (guanosine(37)-N1)-methyltransferase TrmD [Candidatus Microgenomates bacterium]
MKISILTLFPEMFKTPFDSSILKRAQEKKLLTINLVDIRDFGIGKHKVVDDKPYGGGAGMVLRIDVLEKAINSAKCKKACKEKVILLDPQGKIFCQEMAEDLTKYDHLILICGHYEGFDERIRELVDEEISIGDYVLTGGELPAMVVTETVSRLLPGVLGKTESSLFESFQKIEIDNKKVNVLEYPQYTRPDDYKGIKVPQILLSGNHEEISKWRIKEAIEKTKKRRPDLLKS